jgi:hypothetical protein
MTGDIWPLINTNLAVTVVVMSVVAVPSFRTMDPSYIDAVSGDGVRRPCALELAADPR